MALPLAVVGAALALVLGWPALAAQGDRRERPIPGGWIRLRERPPLSPVLIVRRDDRTTYVKLPAAKRPGICDVVHWHVRWPFVTVVAQPAEDHGGRIDCAADLDLSVIWVADFGSGVAKPVVYAAGLDYPVGP